MSASEFEGDHPMIIIFYIHKSCLGIRNSPCALATVRQMRPFQTHGCHTLTHSHTHRRQLFLLGLGVALGLGSLLVRHLAIRGKSLHPRLQLHPSRARLLNLSLLIGPIPTASGPSQAQTFLLLHKTNYQLHLGAQ